MWAPHVPPVAATCLAASPLPTASPGHQAVTAGLVPAHCAQGAVALPCQLRVTNHPPRVRARGHLLPRSPGLVALWPGPGVRARGWESGSSTLPPGWRVAPEWWLRPVPHPVPPTPAGGSSWWPPRCLFFRPLGIFLARTVCSQVVQQGKGQLCGKEPWPTPSSRCGGYRLAAAQSRCPPVCHWAQHREWHGSRRHVARVQGVNGPVRAMARRRMLAHVAVARAG